MNQSWQNEHQIVKCVEKSLESFGFQYAVRHCRAPKHGEGAYIVENWSAEDVGIFIREDIDKLVQDRINQVMENLSKKRPLTERISTDEKYDAAFMNGWNNAISTIESYMKEG